MAVVIAYEADTATAQRLRLAVKYVDTGTLFNNHDLMEIVMIMLREGSLRRTRFDSHREMPAREEISAV